MLNIDRASLKVTGESSIEMFATKNKVVYVSPAVYVSNKLTRARYGYRNAIAMIQKQGSTLLAINFHMHAGPLDRSAHQILSSW